MISVNMADIKKMENNTGEEIISENNHYALLEKLNNYMIEEKPYLFNNITLEDICKELETNRTYLSQIINANYSQHFNEYINSFRIKEALQLLADSKYAHISIEGIGQMAGFKSKAVFHQNFKKFTGITPMYFRKKTSST